MICKRCGEEIPTARVKLIEKSEKEARMGVGVKLERHCVPCESKKEEEEERWLMRLKAPKSQSRHFALCRRGGGHLR